MIQSINSLSTSSSVVPIINAQPIKSSQRVQQETAFDKDTVKLTISPEARKLFDKYQTSQKDTTDESQTKNLSQPSNTASKSNDPSKPSTSPTKLSPEDERVLQRLSQTDLDVKTHEHQHVATAGGYVESGPVYNYTTGPDGKRYAVGGHVSLDMSSIPNNPEATISKAQVIKRAALAPANPSGADRAVAAAAAKMEMKAREQLRTEQGKNQNNDKEKIKAYNKSSYQLGQTVNMFL